MRSKVNTDGRAHLTFPPNTFGEDATLESIAEAFAEFVGERTGSPTRVSLKERGYCVSVGECAMAYHIGRYGWPPQVEENKRDLEILDQRPLPIGEERELRIGIIVDYANLMREKLGEDVAES